jgi:hypothetical protein
VDNDSITKYEIREVVSKPRRLPMKDILIVLAIIGVWFVLQRYVLPKLGVST